MTMDKRTHSCIPMRLAVPGQFRAPGPEKHTSLKIELRPGTRPEQSRPRRIAPGPGRIKVRQHVDFLSLSSNLNTAARKYDSGS